MIELDVDNSGMATAGVGLVALALLMRFRGCLIGLCLGDRGCLVDRGDVQLGQRLDTPRSLIVDALDLGRVYD